MILILTFLINLSAHATIEPFLGKWTGNSNSPGGYEHEVLETSSITRGRCSSVTMDFSKTPEEKFNLVVKYTCGKQMETFQLLGISASHGMTLFYDDNAIGVDRGKSIFIKYKGAEITLSQQTTPFLTVYKQTETSLFEIKILLKPFVAN